MGGAGVGGDTGGGRGSRPWGPGFAPARVTPAGAFLGVGEGVRPRGCSWGGRRGRASAGGGCPWGIDEGLRLGVAPLGVGRDAPRGDRRGFAPAGGHRGAGGVRARGGSRSRGRPLGVARTHIREGAPWGSARARAHDALLESVTVRNSIILIDMLPIGLIG